MSKKIKYLSLFSGIAGFELGIKKAYENFNRHQLSKQEAKTVPKDRTNSKELRERGKQNAICVGYSEFDPSCDKQNCKGYHAAISWDKSKCDTCGKIKTQYAIQVYENKFNHKNYGDITKIKAKELPDFDLVVGGFPCQSFSIAGKRGGFSDTRGTLFFDIARIIREKQPRFLLLENVKGLLSHDQGRTFYTIITTLDELGYDCQWQVLNSKNFGVPQNRERVFIVGHLRGEPRPKVFPFTGSSEENKNVVAPTVIKMIGSTQKNAAIMENISPALTEAMGKGGGQVPMKISNQVALTERRTDEAKKIRRESMKQGKDFSPRRGKTLEPRTDNLANCITAAQGKEHFIQDLDFEDEDLSIRRLTPLECERLQGFPDNWTKYGVEANEKIKISDTQRYKMVGNAVTVNVITAIIERLLCDTK